MPRPPEPEVISVRLPSRLELLGLLDCVTNSVCERMQFGSDVTTRISMSVIEAGTNAIQHGHKRDASRVFDVDYRMFGDRLEVAVHDTGVGFDLSAVNGDMTSPDHLFDARGRGIFIMRSCMDTVNYEFSEGGTVCRLVMHRAPAEARASG
jgi:serine/threonine-protein kinase RsbW